MPELPEVEALADHLRRHAVGRAIGRVDVVAFSVLTVLVPAALAWLGVTAQPYALGADAIVIHADMLDRKAHV